jgi:hypothetical protein
VGNLAPPQQRFTEASLRFASKCCGGADEPFAVSEKCRCHGDSMMNKFRKSQLLLLLLGIIAAIEVKAQTRSQLLTAASVFPAMPRETAQLVPFVGGLPTFSSGTPFNDIEYTLFDTDYMEGETHGYDLFMPADPADAFPGTNRVKLVRCVNNLDLDVSYGGSKGDRVILGLDEVAVPFFLRGPDGIDNDYAVIQNFDYNHGYVQLKGQPTDYRLEYFRQTEGVKTEGYYLFYVKNTTPDLVAFIFPCQDIGLPISGNAPRNALAFCNSDNSLRLTNPLHFRYAQPTNPTVSVPKGIAQVGGKGREVVGAMAVDSQGNVYLGGLTDSNLDDKTDASNEVFITKLTPQGTVAWTFELPTAEGTLLFDAITDETFLYTAGRTQGALPGFTNKGRWDGIILKIRLDTGELVASSQWGNPSIDGYGNIIFDDAGNLFVSGQGSPDEPASTDDKYLVAKYRKSDLSNVWRQLDVPPATGFIASAEAWGGLSYIPGDVPGNGRLVSGGWFITASGANGFMAVYDNLNAPKPTRKHAVVLASQGTRADWVLDNAVDKEGNIYAVGFTTGNLQGQPLGEGDAYIVKYRPDLTNPTFVQVGTAKSDCFRKLDIDPIQGRLYAVGYTYGNYVTPVYRGTNPDPKQESGDVLVQQFDFNLNRLAALQMGTLHEERALCALRGNLLYVGGMTEGAMTGTHKGSFDGFAVALNATDLSVGGALVLSTEPTPERAALVHPNPTSSRLRIDLGEAEVGTYQLTNLMGQSVQAGVVSAGTTTLDLCDLPAGIYLVHLVVNSQSIVRRVVKQ